MEFQMYLNEKGLITNFDWDYKKEAIEFLRKKTKEDKELVEKLRNTYLYD